MSYYHIGAAAWPVTQYKGLAKGLAKTNPKPFVVVTSALNGEGAMSWGFDTRAGASLRYDGVAAAPGDTAYVAVFDKSDADGEPYDEGFFVASTSLNTHTSKNNIKQSAAGWILGGIASLVGVIAIKKRKGR